MSPEQVRGDELDGRSDVFSVGVMLHEMATGERPFTGGSAAELFSAVLRDDPPPVGLRRPDLPDRFQRVILRCLAKAPAERYPTAQDLLDDLIALRDGPPSEAGPRDAVAVHAATATTPSASGPSRLARSRRSLVAAVVLVAAAALLATWFATGRGDRPPAVSGRSILAVLPFVNLGSEQDAYFAVGITDEIRSRLATIGQLGVISRTSMRAYENTSKTIREIGRELGTDYVLEGTIQWDRSQEPGRVRIKPRLVRVADDTQLWSDGYEREVTEIFGLQAEIATRIAEALDLTLAQAEHRALGSRPTGNIAAYQAYLQGMKQLNAPGFSRESFELGVQMFERAVALDPDFALAEARLASMNARIFHYGFDRSDERLARARTAADRALALQPELPEAHLALGHYYYWGERDYPRALEALDEAHALAPGNSEIMLAQAYVKRRQGDFAATVELFERERVLNPRDPNAVVGLGETQATLRRYAEAERAYRRAIDLAPDDPYPYTELALVYLKWRGDAVAARAILREMPPTESSEACRVGYLVELLARDYDAALEQLDSCPGEVMEAGAFYRPAALDAGLTRLLMGQPDAARASLAEARSLLADRLAQTPDDPRLHASLGLALAGLGEPAPAVRHGRRAVTLNPLSRDALEAPVPIIDLAQILVLTGAHARAIAQLDSALSIPSILSTAWLETDPRWDPIRGEAAFAALLAAHATGEQAPR
jgi:serine/threonine-protein kinase